MPLAKESAGSKPDPDPTVRTNENLYREIDRIQKEIEKTPGLIKDEIGHLKELHTVKFESVAQQFLERDKRTEQLSEADSTAISAALQAQKEAAAKTETNFSELIKLLQLNFQVVTKSQDDTTNELRSRIDRGEGHTKGLGDSWLVLVGFVMAAAALGGLAVELLRH